jgi:exosortase/archaeosortase family protein
MKPLTAHIQKYPDIPAVLLLLAATGVLFWPASWWIAQQTLAHEQLRQSLFLLGFAAVVMWLDHRRTLRPVIEVSRPGLLMLLVAFLLMGAGLLFPYPFLPLLALALALGAFVHVLFGNQGFSLSLPWMVGFATFLLFVLFFHFLDWPLREMAGLHSAQILVLFGQEVELRTLPQPGGLLLLSVNQHLFEVAAECNGFGLISTSAILSLLLVLSRPMPLFWKLSYVGVGIFIGFSFNILRILGIVTLAPFLPDHYDLMHEIVGLVALFGGLALLWWIVAGRNEA